VRSHFFSTLFCAAAVAFPLVIGLPGKVTQAHAEARFSTVEVTPQARTLTGFPTPVVPLSGRATPTPAFNEAIFNFAVDTAGQLRFQLNGAQYGQAVSVSAGEAVERRLSPGRDNLRRGFSSTNTFQAEFRLTNDAAASPVTTFTIIVDDQPPAPPQGISADGADRAMRVVWDTPPRSTNEVIDAYIVSYSTTPFAGMDTATVEQKPSQRVRLSPLDDMQARITGLENGQTYHVTVRAVDWVEHVSDFPRDAAGNIISVTVQPVTTVTMAELVGEEGGCFIATAAYGSYEAAQVQVLREVRDRILLQTAPGRAFVRWYYEISPPSAQWIARHDGARAAVRILLWPAIALGHIVLHPAWSALGIAGFALVLPRLRRRFRFSARETAT
jgi:hypothetical protein